MRRFIRTQRLSIVATPTVSGLDHPPAADDPQASLRAELLGRLLNAQFDLESTLAELTKNGAGTDALENQLAALAQAQRLIATANPAALAVMRSEMMGLVSQSAISVQQARDGTTCDATAEKQRERAQAATSALYDDLFKKDVLRPYLQFSSADEKLEYEERTRERQEAIERERAKETMEGERNALLLMGEQLSDDRAHGADRSPEFARLEGQAQSALREVETLTPSAGKPEPAKDDMAAAMDAFRSAGVSMPSEDALLSVAPKGATTETRQR